MVDKNNNKRKLNKNNKRAIAIFISFFILVSASYAAYELSDIHETIRDVGVEAKPYSENTMDDSTVQGTTESSSELTETPTEAPTTESSTASEDTSATEDTKTEEPKTTEKATEKTTENTTADTQKTEDKTTEKESTSEVTENTATTEDISDNPIFSENNTILPDIVDVPCGDWYDSRKFMPNSLQSADYFDKTVFIGDSRTESLAYYSGFDNVNAFAYKGLNVGALDSEKCIKINGTKYTVMEAVSITRYENYYISFGINELGWEYLEVFIEDIDQLVDHILSINPNAVIYIASVVPVSYEISETDDVFNLDNVNKFNTEIIKYCHDKENVIYTDYAAAVSDEYGYLPEEGTTDGKHCTADYSRRIMEYILLHTYRRR